jgi:hypothetical protein
VSGYFLRLLAPLATGTPLAIQRNISLSYFSFNYVLLMLYTLHFLEDHQFLASRPPLPEEGPINAEVAPADSGAPEACENQDGDEVEGSLEGSDSTLSLPLAESEAQGA